MLHPLPFTTFGEIAALGFRARVYCSRCYEHRSIDLAAEHLRDRCFATTRFRCTKIRYTGAVCGRLGAVEIEPSVLLPVGGEDTLAFLSCGTCLPSWERASSTRRVSCGLIHFGGPRAFLTAATAPHPGRDRKGLGYCPAVLSPS